LLRRGNRALLLLGLVIAAILAASSPISSGFIGTPPQLLLAAAIGLPFGIAMPLLMGEFQGDQRFGIFAGLSAGQAAIKLVAAIVLGLVLGPVGVIAGISVASIALYLVAWWLLRSKHSVDTDRDWWRRAARYLAIVLPSTLALALLLSTDVVLVKHYFSSREAGEYSAVAALGRAIFWGASGVAAVLFPKVVFRSTKGEHASGVVLASIALVALGGAASLGLLSVSSRWLLTAFAGGAYAHAAVYLPWYAIGMTLLGATAVLIATHQSHGRAGFLAILLPLALLEPILIAAFHAMLLQVVQVVDISMALSAFALAAWYLVEARSPRFAPALTHQLQVSRDY
jgi:O-antigen/teichoic acid export membrane protein